MSKKQANLFSLEYVELKSEISVIRNPSHIRGTMVYVWVDYSYTNTTLGQAFALVRPAEGGAPLGLTPPGGAALPAATGSRE